MDLLWWQVFGFGLFAKTSLVLAAALFLSWLTKRATAQLRHLVLLMASMMVLLLPAISLLVPEWQLSLVTLSQSASLASHSNAQPSQLVDDSERSWVWWLLIIWFVGFLVVLGWLVVGRLLGWTVLRNAKPLTDQRLLGVVDKVCQQLGLSSRMRLLVTDQVSLGGLFWRPGKHDRSYG